MNRLNDIMIHAYGQRHTPRTVVTVDLGESLLPRDSIELVGYNEGRVYDRKKAALALVEGSKELYRRFVELLDVYDPEVMELAAQQTGIGFKCIESPAMPIAQIEAPADPTDMSKYVQAVADINTRPVNLIKELFGPYVCHLGLVFYPPAGLEDSLQIKNMIGFGNMGLRNITMPIRPEQVQDHAKDIQSMYVRQEQMLAVVDALLYTAPWVDE